MSRTIRMRYVAARVAAAAMLAALPLMTFAPVAGATQAGGLDPSFGTGGRVVTDFGGRTANGMALQADGKIVVVGGPDVAVARYNADGSPDSAFGSVGQVFSDFGAADAGRAVAVQSDGKIVAVGTNGCCGSVAIILARFNANGTPDATFDSDGKVTLAIPGAEDYAQAIALQADGRILVGGSTDGALLVARLEADGSLDATFDTDGLAVPFPGDSEQATGLAVLSDGKIVVGGTRFGCCAPFRSDFELVQLNDDGSTDLSFGPNNDGRVLTDINAESDDYAFGMALQSDGAIVLAGQSNNVFQTYDLAVARFTTSGSLDPTFGTNGVVITNLGPDNEQARGVAIDPDGKIVVAGQSTGNQQSDFAVVRYNSNGTPDAGFGTGGVVKTDFAGGDDKGAAVAVQPDGNVVVAGYTVSGTFKFGLARYLGVAPPATVPDAPTSVTAAAGDAEASLGWVAPPDGGSQITSYTIDWTSTAGDGSTTAAGGVTSATITGLTNGADYTFTVSATNDVGTGPSSDPSNIVAPQAGAPPPQTTTEEIPPSGGTATTDPDSIGPTPEDPVTTSVVVPSTAAGGSVTVAETAVTQTPPAGGYQFLGQQIDITSTVETDSNNPLTIVFTIDSSVLLAATGMATPPPESVAVTRAEEGSPVVIPDCIDVGPPIDPDPCVSDRQYVGDDLQITILTGSASHWNTAVKPIALTVADSGYTPKTVTVAQGGVAVWTFTGVNPHSVTDNLKLGAAKGPRFDSGPLTSGRFGSDFRAAGTYTYGSTVRADRKFAGTIGVPLLITPTTGSTATAFSVTWSSATINGYVFDVQYRFKRAGAKNFAAAKTWQTGVTTVSGVFTPPSGVGTYALSARLRNATTGMASLWSPEFSITVQ